MVFVLFGYPLEVTGVAPSSMGNLCACHVCNGKSEETGRSHEYRQITPSTFQTDGSTFPPKDNWWFIGALSSAGMNAAQHHDYGSIANVAILVRWAIFTGRTSGLY